MPIYAKTARAKYNEDHDVGKLITTVWKGINQYSSDPDGNPTGRQIAKNATLAFIALHNKDGNGKIINSWIAGARILKRMGIKNYNQNKSYGLWPWLRDGADVIEEKGAFRIREYRIKGEFLGDIWQSLS